MDEGKVAHDADRPGCSDRLHRFSNTGRARSDEWGKWRAEHWAVICPPPFGFIVYHGNSLCPEALKEKHVRGGCQVAIDGDILRYCQPGYFLQSFIPAFLSKNGDLRARARNKFMSVRIPRIQNKNVDAAACQTSMRCEIKNNLFSATKIQAWDQMN
ncbi:hypothetical protein AA14337_3076 [Acetobacter malorum DSM 14337]|uniref:Uncharacterized protein n=1 Tax=Acetobacter malorum DSM 14337 TaxID=1307910 RepID=A0ABQ0PZI8_9PROT|nr:hypothetical protein AA14337_3076 [Acetobacter malorum DSM 14337]